MFYVTKENHKTTYIKITNLKSRKLDFNETPENYAGYSQWAKNIS